MIDQVEDCLWCNEDVIVELCLKLLLIVSHSTISRVAERDSCTRPRFSCRTTIRIGAGLICPSFFGLYTVTSDGSTNSYVYSTIPRRLLILSQLSRGCWTEPYIMQVSSQNMHLDLHTIRCRARSRYLYNATSR